MSSDDLKRALNLATRFRAAIEAVDKGLPLALAHFPRGSCGDAVPLLGTYFIENGLHGFDYICGECHGPVALSRLAAKGPPNCGHHSGSVS